MDVTTQDGCLLGKLERFQSLHAKELVLSEVHVRTVQGKRQRWPITRVGSNMDVLRPSARGRTGPLLKSLRLGFAQWLAWNTPEVSDEEALGIGLDIYNHPEDIEPDFSVLIVDLDPSVLLDPTFADAIALVGLEGRSDRLTQMLNTPPEEWF